MFPFLLSVREQIALDGKRTMTKRNNRNTTDSNVTVLDNPETVTDFVETVESSESTFDVVAPLAESVETVPSFEEIEAGFENGTVDDAALLEYVRNGILTAEQIDQIRGLTVEELSTSVSKESQQSQSGPMYSYDAAKDVVMRRIKEGLYKGGAIGLIRSMKNRNEISIESHDALIAMLSVDDPNQETISNGATNYSNLGNKIAVEISSNYKPTHSFEEAKKEAKSIVDSRISAEISFEGTKASKLLIDLADIAVALLERPSDESMGKPFSITYADFTVQIGDNKVNATRCTAHKTLWDMIRKEKLLGAPEEVNQEVGGKVLKLGSTYDPYRDPAIRPIIDKLCMKALLLAYGHVTKVQFGYMPNTRKRPSRGQIFQDKVEDETKFWKFACVPANVIKPRNYEVVMVNKPRLSNEGNTVNNYVNVARDVGPNKDEHLVWLFDDAVEPYFQHCFAGWELEYETEARSDKDGGGVMPSGVIIDAYHKNVGPKGGRKRNSSAATADKVKELTDKINKLTAERDAAQGGLDPADRLKSLQALVGLTNNTALELPVAEQCYELELAYVFAEKRLSIGRPNQDVANRAFKLYLALGEHFNDNKDGTGEFINKNIRFRVTA